VNKKKQKNFIHLGWAKQLMRGGGDDGRWAELMGDVFLLLFVHKKKTPAFPRLGFRAFST
jgi:hypothetical protein